jgi:hypothetical protein
MTMSALKAAVVLIGLLLSATQAGAMSGLEFLETWDNNAVNKATITEPFVRQFVREGYHNVPSWANLGLLMYDLILEKGYRDKDIAEIAKEAAIANGMSK